MQPDVLIFMYEDSCTVSAKIMSLTTEHKRGKDKRKEFISVRQTG